MSDEDKMLRALAGEVGKQIRQEMKERNIRDFNVDRSMLAISDWETEQLYRDAAIMDSTLLEDPLFQHLWGSFRQEQLTGYLRANKDSLGSLALMYESSVPDNIMNSMYFWQWLKSKGADNQGDVVEILGPMRAGKTNFMVWLMRLAVHQNIYILTNIPLKKEIKKITQIHSLGELLLNMAKLRKNDPDCITCIFLDEQAGVKGSGSRTSTTREARWADNFIRLIGKFGASLWRARQFDDVIKEQRGLVTIEFEKSRNKLSEAHGTIKKGEYLGTEIIMKPIPDLHDEYDTRSISSFTIDIDMEEVNRRYAGEENKISENYTMEDALTKIIEDMKKAKNKKQNKSRERVLELYAQGMVPLEIAEETGYSLKQVYNIINDE